MEVEEISQELNLFEGLEGFENFNPLDDSSLLDILGDWEEGTLVSMLDSKTLLNEVSGEISNDIHTPCNSSDFDVMEFLNDPRVQPHCELSEAIKTETDFPKDPLIPETIGSVVAKCSVQETLMSGKRKRARMDQDHLVSCVEHDHCYGERQSRAPATTSSSDEEGSLSDAGYDTMSSSTSPGAQTTSPAAPQAGMVLKETKPDPVALIDARIQHFMHSREVNLTEEEKETLKAEGLPIPTTLPLTKAEEKALRGVRRRIRNKMAAQESRKRKKEQLTSLEEKCKQYCGENSQLKRKVETLESENSSLKEEVTKLKKLLSTQLPSSNKTTRAGACLMVIVLCFAVFFGSFTPHGLWARHNDYSTSSVKSRSLLSVGEHSNFQTMASNWFREIFMLQKDIDVTPSDTTPLFYGPLRYYEHVYSHFSDYLNFSNTEKSCIITPAQHNDSSHEICTVC